MSNVLPQEARKGVWRRYSARFIMALALVLFAVAALSALALSPSYFVLRIDNASVAPQQSAANAQAASDGAAIAHAQLLVRTLSPLLATSSANALIADAVAARPAGVSINHITVTTGTPGTIILSGTAPHIESISAYQAALVADAHFSSVSVPIGDLAGNVDGTFSITLSANF